MATADKVIELVRAEAGGFDTDMRQFVSRLMAGYETAHRRVADLCDTLSERLAQSEAVTARALEMQVRLAEEREELLSRRAEREHAARLVEQRGEALHQITGDLRAIVPLLAKRLIGVPLTGDDSHGLTDFLSALSAEQIEAVIVEGTLNLTEAQRIQLGSVLTALSGANT